MKGLNSPVGYRYLWKGGWEISLLRQVQQMANGDYTIATRAGLHHLIPEAPQVLHSLLPVRRANLVCAIAGDKALQ